MPAYVSLASQSLQKALIGTTSQAYSHPFDATVDEDLQAYLDSGADLSVSVFVLLGLSFLPASVLVFLVKERVCKVRCAASEGVRAEKGGGGFGVVVKL
jgi:hypothetical protein